MAEILIQFVKLIESVISSKTGKFIRENADVIWFPIVPIGSSGSQMGISNTGEWVVEVTEGVHHLDKPQLFVYVMVLLEKPFDTVYGQIQKLFENISLKENPYSVFPFINIIKAGFEQNSDYWADLSFEWYDALPNEYKCELKETMSKINNAKWASQKIKHRARRELIKLNKS